jgi:galactose mutarotase-like enzyme
VIRVKTYLRVELKDQGVVTYYFSDNIHCAILWSDGREYICVEPMMDDLDLFGRELGHYLKNNQEENLVLTLVYEWQ